MFKLTAYTLKLSSTSTFPLRSDSLGHYFLSIGAIFYITYNSYNIITPQRYKEKKPIINFYYIFLHETTIKTIIITPIHMFQNHKTKKQSTNFYNRVGGKRSSFLPTFVFRPLTPPYVRFRIRRFLFWIPFEIRLH